jgi:uncharacterized protein (DUF433 family)
VQIGNQETSDVQNTIMNSLHDQIDHIVPERRRELMAHQLGPHPHKEADPAEVVIRTTGTPVWAIIGYLPAVGGDLEQVARDYEIDLEAVIAAVAYYLDHQTLIDWRLVQNRDESVRFD